MLPGEGYRWLRVGEKIAPGDQLWGNESCRWVGAWYLVGQTVQYPEHIRRRIESRRKAQDVDALIKRHTGASHARAKADHLPMSFNHTPTPHTTMPSFIPTDPTAVKPRVETPHKYLNTGRYIMSWGGYEVLVGVRIRDGRPVFQVPTGMTHEVYTVPDAKFYRLPDELQ